MAARSQRTAENLTWGLQSTDCQTTGWARISKLHENSFSHCQHASIKPSSKCWPPEPSRACKCHIPGMQQMLATGSLQWHSHSLTAHRSHDVFGLSGLGNHINLPSSSFSLCLGRQPLNRSGATRCHCRTHRRRHRPGYSRQRLHSAP